MEQQQLLSKKIIKYVCFVAVISSVFFFFRIFLLGDFILENNPYSAGEMSYCDVATPTFFILSPDVPSLYYYSHGLAFILSIVVGFLILGAQKKSVKSKLFFGMMGLFCVWLILDLIQWATDDPVLMLFLWGVSVVVEVLFFGVALLIARQSSKDTKYFSAAIVSMGILAGIITILIPSTLGIVGVDIQICEVIEGVVSRYLVYIYEFLCLVFILHIAFINKSFFLSRQDSIDKYFLLSIVSFLALFLAGNLYGSFSENWIPSQYGLVGMPLFVLLLSYVFQKYNTSSTKVFLANFLVLVLLTFTVANLFVRKIENVRIVVVFNSVAVMVLGYVLVKSVKKEVESREKIEELADSLVKSNEKLESANIKLKELDKLKSEFLSLASHQIRNPLTAIKGYASLVLDGTYGEVSHAVREAVDRMYQSTQSLVIIVSDFLDISRIEQGTMKYDFTSFDINKLAVQVVEEFRPNILKAGLTISSVAGSGDYFVNADQGKIKQVIGNLIDNAIKYTPKGSIKVALSRHSLSDGTSGRVRVTVSDTGVGIDQEVIPQLFAKFTRDKDAFKTNVSGTGLGLYLAKQMMQAHHGKIWAESDGRGKGSRFIIELDTIR